MSERKRGLTLAVTLWLGVFLLPSLLAAQGNVTTPTEDELLDFDSADKAGRVPPTRVAPAAPPPPEAKAAPPAPAPAPVVPAPAAPKQVQTKLPPKATPAPKAEAQTKAPPPAVPAVPNVDVPALPPAPEISTYPGIEPPNPEGALPNTPPAPSEAKLPGTNLPDLSLPGANPSDAEALEGPSPVQPPASGIQPQTPAENNLPPPPLENEPPPPEIVKEGTPAESNPPAPLENEPPPPEVNQSATEEPPPSNVDSGEISAADKANESRFARIFQKYNKSELGDEKWGQIAGPKAAENYSLQQGDTLWDISAKFFGNGFYWPKVWQLNDEITNPHMVQTGNILKFSPGTTTAAPSLAVEENNISDPNVEMSFEDMPEPAPETEEIPTEQSPTGNIITIPPPKKRRPVLAKIPSSFPDWRDKSGSYDSTGFSMEVFKKTATSHRTASVVQAIVSEEPWSPNGKVIEMEGNTSVAATYQSVMVKMDSAVQTGDILTVFSNAGFVMAPDDGEKIGSEVETRAEIEIQEPIEGTTDSYRALVTFSALPVRIGDSVKLGRQMSRADFDVNGTRSSVSARIINGEMGSRAVLGLHNIVFLNRGEMDGLQVGSILPVIKNVRLRNPDTILKFDPKPIGLLKVVAVGGHVSTAVIVSARDAIVPGDETAVPAGNNEVPLKDVPDSALNGPPPTGGSEVAPVDTADPPQNTSSKK